MTEENASSTRCLDREDYREIHAALAAWSEEHDEPIPSFSHAKEADLDVLVQLPQQRFFGRAAYSTLEEKAAIIFYTINKRQIFLNGNKRMSTLSLLVFLRINGKQLDVSPDELTKKALWLALTDPLEFPAIKHELVEWIRGHLTDRNER